MAAPRKAALTRSMSDLLRGRWFGHLSDDLQPLADGHVLSVTAFRVAHGRWRQGRLLLDPTNLVLAWEAWTLFRGFGGRVDLPPPHAWLSTGPTPKGLKRVFCKVTLRVADGEYAFGVSRRDAPLLEQVLAAGK